MADLPEPAPRARQAKQAYLNSPLEALVLADVAGNSERLIRTRWVAAVAVVAATAFCVHVLRLPLPELPLYATGLVIALYNSLLTLLMRLVSRDKEDRARLLQRIRRVVVLQVALDWLSMAVFLHLTGGISSPAIPFFLIHMLMVTILLPGQSPYIYVALAIGVLTAIAMLEQAGILPHYHVIPGLPPALHRDPIYIGAQLAFIATTAFATVFLTHTVMQRLRQRERQIAALFAATQAVSSTLSLPEVMERLARSAAEALGERRATIRLLDESGEHLTMMAAYGLSERYLNKGPVDLSGNQLAQEALRGQPVIVSDAANDPRVQYRRAVVEEGIRSMLVVPIMGRTRPLGVLRVYSTQLNRFQQEDAAFAMAIARQGAGALENALAHDALRRANEERAQFVRTVTHELRAPVSGAQSLLRTMLRGLAGELNDQQRDILARLERRLEALMDLINDLLALAASKTTSLQEPPHPLALQPVLRQVVDRLAAQAEEKQIALLLEAPAEDLSVCATEEGLARIFDNLIGNAVKYTPNGGSVRVTVERGPLHAVITVADTGIGIPAEDLPKLWSEFFRASNVRAAGISGTGLGLAIARQLIDRFGGSVSVHSVEGQGTTFTVRLPLAAACYPHPSAPSLGKRGDNAP